MEKENLLSEPIICDVMFNFPKKENELIKNEKKNIQLNYGDQPKSSSIPHITLCSFLVLPERKEKVINSLKEKLRDLKAIQISFNGFDVFSNNVIYTKLEPESSFIPFYNMLKKFRFDNYYKEKNFKISQKPHATLAKIDNNELFSTLSKEYKSKAARSTFVLDNLVIRTQYVDGNSKKYENIKLSR
ncbi:2'-5' RNA ligase family protein [Lacihabitans sp. CCS-44]|uniref:2'-5' RNA ligase family protein n=1 Tax=Lacihabitans sp. CCS-44 TaxID=2487331 RepID=UPI0020CE6BBA|nr:2'-5' RNA ligase family protein [Lacihabitans sp. CCS-44]MCP9755380.1 2'-5' RNA ligase family protein [Lacihabitans sp. CCS-44]